MAIEVATSHGPSKHGNGMALPATVFTIVGESRAYCKSAERTFSICCWLMLGNGGPAGLSADFTYSVE